MTPENTQWHSSTAAWSMVKRRLLEKPTHSNTIDSMLCPAPTHSGSGKIRSSTTSSSATYVQTALGNDIRSTPDGQPASSTDDACPVTQCERRDHTWIREALKICSQSAPTGNHLLTCGSFHQPRSTQS